MLGRSEPASASGGSSPWNCSAPSLHCRATAVTWPGAWSQNTPTGVTNGGSSAMIRAAASGVTKRGVPSTKMKPRASAPASTLSRASSMLVMPQIFTLTISGPALPEQKLPHLGVDVGRAQPERPLQLLGRVHLDQRPERDPLRGLQQLCERYSIERRHDQQHGIGPGGPGLPELVLLQDELLSEHGHLDRRANGHEIV